MKHPFITRYEILCLLDSDNLPPILKKRIHTLGLKLKDFETLDESIQVGLSRLIAEELSSLEGNFPILSNDFNTLSLIN